jgi:hypothetical protein
MSRIILLDRGGKFIRETDAPSDIVQREGIIRGHQREFRLLAWNRLAKDCEWATDEDPVAVYGEVAP